MRKKETCRVHRKVLWVATIIATCFIGGVSPFGAGAPASTCLTRYPKHSHLMTQAASPDTGPGITIVQSGYRPGDVITVQLWHRGSKEFVGFELAAFRSDNPLEIVGQFVTIPEDKAKFITCRGGYKNMVTHKNKDPVDSVSFQWKAPPYNVGRVVFKATVVENYEIFWTNLERELPSLGTLAAVAPTFENVPAEPIVQHPSLDGCGDTKSCFLYPRHCDVNKCIAGVSFQYRPDTDDYLVQMYADSTSNPGYVGVAFSDDDKMGFDETFICAANTQDMSVQYGYNPHYYNERLVTEFVKNARVSREDGRLTCTFEMKANSTVARVDHVATNNGSETVYTRENFDKDKAWHVQLAWGKIMDDSNVVTLHKEMPAVSSSKIHIKENSIHRGSSFHILVQVHAAVMIVAWTFLSGIVTVVARHYKDMMSSRRLLGTKVWFQVHRALAILVVILTGIGLAVIFAHYGSKIREHAVPHAYVGLAVTAALGLQVIAGMLRPGPDHKLRVVFNWGHRLLGQASHILAAVTMFLGFDMDYMVEDMRTFGIIALSVWVGVQVMWHIFFEIISCVLKRNADSYQLDANKENDGESWIPAVLMGFYVIFLAACCAAVLSAFLLF